MHLSSESLTPPLSVHSFPKRLRCTLKLTTLSAQQTSAHRTLQSSQQLKQSRLSASVQNTQLSFSDPLKIYWGRSPRSGSRLLAVTVQAQPHKSLFVPKWGREHQSRYCQCLICSTEVWSSGHETCAWTSAGSFAGTRLWATPCMCQTPSFPPRER